MTATGIAAAITWCRRTTGGGTVLAADEGTGGYGRILTGALTDAGIDVTEVKPPKRGGPKSDALDATGAALSVLRLPVDRHTAPRARGLRDAIGIACTARHRRTGRKPALFRRHG